MPSKNHSTRVCNDPMAIFNFIMQKKILEKSQERVDSKHKLLWKKAFQAKVEIKRK